MIKKQGGKSISVALTVISLLWVVVIIAVCFGIFKAKKATKDIDETTHSQSTSHTTEAEASDKDIIETTKTQTTTTDVLYPQNITNQFSGQKLRKLNLFLSNFSELSYTNITNNEPEKMIQFVLGHTWFNDNSKFSNEYTRNFNGSISSRSVSEEYMNERIKRFFDVDISGYSKNYIYYSDGRYYMPDGDGYKPRSFSKVTNVSRISDGTLKVDFIIFTNYMGDGVIDNNSDLYNGYGRENVYDSEENGTGYAILKEKYFGEGYANYTVVSISG